MTRSFDEWADAYLVCNEFAVAYKRENPSAVLKYGETAEGDLHAYVYDPDEDMTLDATLGQFSAYNPAEYQDARFIGDDHPHVEERAAFDDILAFVAEFGGRAVLTDDERADLEASA